MCLFAALSTAVAIKSTRSWLEEVGQPLLARYHTWVYLEQRMCLGTRPATAVAVVHTWWCIAVTLQRGLNFKATHPLQPFIL